MNFSEWLPVSGVGINFNKPALSYLGWVIVGGESWSPNKCRRCHLDWLRSIVEQCQAASVPVFVKQLGSNVEDSVGYTAGTVHTSFKIKLRHRKGGNWPEDLRICEFLRIN